MPFWSRFGLLNPIRSFTVLTTVVLSACSNVPSKAPASAVTNIVVIDRGWHTEICIHYEDAGASVSKYADGFTGTQFLCFGFGDRHYVVDRNHGFATMLSTVLPSKGALLMTALRASPSAAFGEQNAVSLQISQAGLVGLQRYLVDAAERDDAGVPRRLSEGPYAGSVFFAATATYDLMNTCNTWTADAMRAADLPVNDAVIFASGVMRQARRLAAPAAQ